MIPSKLYIPTSSQNFNNIMSSESISPAAFYERRKFGQRRFVRVEPNQLNDRIALYESIPQFTIPSSDENNFPIYIEIQTKCYDDEMFYESCIDGIYYCDRTIYLSPYNSHFCFQNEGDYRIVYSSQQRSLTTKMTNLYYKSFWPIKSEQKAYDYSLLTDSGKDFSAYIADDRRINKLKGFYLGYLIGMMKDHTPEFVHLYSVTSQISNALSSSITSTYKTINQSVQLEALYQELNDAFRKLSREDEKISDVIMKEEENFGLDGDLLRYIKTHGWFEDWKRQMQIPDSYQVKPFSAPIVGSSSAQDAKDNYINDILAHIAKLQGKRYPNSSELPSINQKTLTYIPEEGFLGFVYKEAFKELYNGQDFVEDRYQFSLDICKQYKSEVSEDDFAKVREYLNALNKNLKSYTEFDLNSIADDNLRAYAAFCQKGDPDDFGKLEDHLIKAEIGSLHKGFALAGMIFGYADMPKTFTKILVSDDNEEFIKNHYRYMVQNTCMNITDITDDIEIGVKKLTTPTPKNINEVVDAPDLEKLKISPRAFLEILNDLIRTNSYIYKDLKRELENDTTKYSSFVEFKKRINTICISSKNYNNDKEERINLAMELAARVNDAKAFLSILNDGRLNKTRRKAIYNHFILKVPKRSTSTQTRIAQTHLDFDNDTREKQIKHSKVTTNRLISQNLLISTQDDPQSIFHSLDWIDITASMLPVDERVGYIKNIDWFVVNYSQKYNDEKGETKGGCYYAKETINNNNVIRHIANFLKDHVSKSHIKLSSASIKNVEKYLKEHYHD